jgi:tetratricopeptide (TPR) repeat protein
VECHAEIVESYRTSAMHDALTLPTGEGSPEAKLVGREFVDADTGITIRFDAADGHYTQTLVYRDPEGVERSSHTFRVDLVVGSGHATRSYLQVRDRQMLELPLTWYRELDTAALSPGDGFRTASSRIATRLCMGCHTGNVTPMNTDADLGFRGSLSLGITCIRCHGEGEEHVESGDPATISHPAKLEPDRQDELCAQCHLSAGFEVERWGRTLAQYRPGESLTDWVAVLRRAEAGPAGGSAIGGHGARLALSACATQTADRTDGSRLTCATCHNPHHGFKSPDIAERTNRGCFVCHAEEDCHAPSAERGARACFTCHMAVVPSQDIGHTKVTDHWIRRRPQQGGQGVGGPQSPGVLALQGGPLQNLLDRDGKHPLHQLYLAKGYTLGVEVAVAEMGRPAPDWMRRAFAALDAHEATHGRAPESDLLRGRLLALDRRPDAALPLLRELVAARPDVPQTHAALGYALADAGSTQAAVQRLRAAHKLSAYDTSVATVLARSLHKLGNSSEAPDVLEDVRQRMGPRRGISDLAIQVASESGDIERALQHAYDGLALAPKDPRRLSRAAFLALRTESAKAQGIPLLRAALEHAPEHVDALVQLTEALWDAGEQDEARTLLGRVRRVAPQDARVRDLIQRVR